MCMYTPLGLYNLNVFSSLNKVPFRFYNRKIKYYFCKSTLVPRKKKNQNTNLKKMEMENLLKNCQIFN